MQENRRRKWINGIIVGVVLAALIVAAVVMLPWMKTLLTAEGRAAFEAQVQELGIWGWLLLLGIQLVQIVVAVLPGEPIELIAGYVYGVWGGLLICEVGILLGTMLVFYLSRAFKYKFVTLFISREKLDGYRFLRDTQRLEGVTFLLFFIPGTPKDALTYVAGLTQIKPLRFFLIAMIARVPSVITSTIAGATLSDGNWKTSLIVFGATGLLAVLGILVDRLIVRRLKQKKADALSTQTEADGKN